MIEYDFGHGLPKVRFEYEQPIPISQIEEVLANPDLTEEQKTEIKHLYSQHVEATTSLNAAREVQIELLVNSHLRDEAILNEAKRLEKQISRDSTHYSSLLTEIESITNS